MADAPIERLIEGLYQRNLMALDVRQIGALLAWLGGSGRDADARLLCEKLGKPGEDEELRARVFEQLDIELFDGERLLLQSAGVDVSVDEKDRRRRFRLLLSVFHPDRFPARSEWLTSRLQIVNRAYSDFKAGRLDDAVDGSPLPPVKAAGKEARPRQPVWQGISPSWKLGGRFREQLGQDRYLGHKIVGVLLVITALPVISILLDAQSDRADIAPVEEPERIEERWFGHDLDLAVDEWPLVSPDPEWLANVDMESVADHPVEELAEWPVEIEAFEAPGWMRVARVVEPQDVLELADPVEVVQAVGVAETEEMVDGDEVAGVVEEDVIADEVEVINDEPEEVLVVEVPGEEEDERWVAESVEAEEVLVEVGVVGGLETSGTKPRPANEEALVGVPALVEAEDDVALGPGTMSLGLLGNHQVGNVLTEYRDSVEAGDMDGVLRVMGRSPRENANEGREWFEYRYGELFDASKQRSLSMHVRNARRSGREWLVEVDYRLDMAREDSDELERLEREVRYSISPDPFRLRIISIEY